MYAIEWELGGFRSFTRFSNVVKMLARHARSDDRQSWRIIKKVGGRTVAALTREQAQELDLPIRAASLIPV